MLVKLHKLNAALLITLIYAQSGAANQFVPPNISDIPQSLNITVDHALEGNSRAQVIIAKIYAEGHGVKKNLNKALAWYAIAGENGNSEAQYNAARIYSYDLDERHPDRYTNAIYWFKKLAEKDNIDAQIQLSTLYLIQFQNYKEALFWVKKAAKTDISGMYNLAVMYGDKESPFYDAQKSFNWFEKAAIGGIPDAMYYIGHDYYKGKVVTQDNLAAYKWIKRSIAKTRSNSKTNRRVVEKRKAVLKEIEKQLSHEQLTAANYKSN